MSECLPTHFTDMFWFFVDKNMLRYIRSLTTPENKQENTVKTPQVVTSIKQSPVLKGHLFLILSYELNLF
jgi:hypothetical protein